MVIQMPSFSPSSGGAGAGALHETDTTILQTQTEKECQPYFMDLTTLSSQEQHDLVRIGLLPEPLPPNENNETGSREDYDQEQCNNPDKTVLEIQLLREQHREYLAQVWTRALRAPFVSLDSSRPWILYWCLQGYDLLSHNTDTPTKTTTNKTKGWITPQDGRKMVTTLEDCWTGYWVTEEEIPQLVTDHCSTDDKEELFFQEHDDDEHRSATTTTTTTGPRYYCGGFGGGPGQMAHAATTYAAVLALCILATDDEEETTEEENTNEEDVDASYTQLSYPLRAQRVLHEIRLPLYRWMCSLQVYHPTPKTTTTDTDQEHQPELPQQPHKEEGAYRMQHDGEIDVRATYTIACCATLLGVLTKTKTTTTESPPKTNYTLLGRRAVMNFIISCQTYEGGFGGEPYAEAHGGYTFCGVAALTLLCPRHELQWTGLHDNTENTTTDDNNEEDDVVSRLDIVALTGWLTRRQMRYEGGFSGRTNKLVDGCYSFWQGGATAIVSSCYADFYGGGENNKENENDDNNNTDNDNHDPWLRRYYQQQQQQHKQHDADDNTGMDRTIDMPFPLLYNVRMLERYILLCAQEPTGGLRDKPSKSRDFYHTNYNLCGLSIAQHYSSSSSSSQNDTNTVAADTVDNSGDTSSGRSAGIDETFGDQQQTKVEATHPVYNIRIDRVAKILAMDW